jgi:3-Oxoacyl-[acyl-carrier-protein (ACP)] synthase III C terminal
VYGPEVRALAGRYLVQMIDELRELPDPDDDTRTLLDAIELVVPHQANETIVTELAGEAGLSPDQLYLNIGQVGNVSVASIPLAIHDAVRDGVIARPTRVFTPGFGAGAVAGFAVLRVDPAIVAPERTEREGGGAGRGGPDLGIVDGRPTGGLRRLMREPPRRCCSTARPSLGRCSGGVAVSACTRRCSAQRRSARASAEHGGLTASTTGG